MDAQAAWTLLNPATQPPQRTEVVMASDLTGAILFGGLDGRITKAYDDVWRFDGTNWTDLKPTGTLPPGRSRLAGDYDFIRGRLVIFGGDSQYNGGGALGDTWEYDSATNTWSNPQPATAPTARIHARMVFHLKSLRMILFGGARTAETWAWDGVTWTDLTPTLATSPSGRDQVNMAHNSRTGEIVLFGGTTNGGNGGIIGDTWTFDGKAWTQVVTTTIPGGSGIRNGKLTYDEVRDRMVLFGGVRGSGGFSQSAWEFDGVDWVERLPATLPVGRAGMGFMFVKSLGAAYMFSGWPYPANNETWHYQTDKVASYTVGGSGCVGQAGTPSLTGSAPWLGDDFVVTVHNVPTNGPAFVFFGVSNTQWGATSLPLNLGFMGAPQCALHIDPLLLFGMATTSGVATLKAPLPNTAAFGGLHFFNQAYAADNTANKAGIVVSNYGKGTAGLR